jgi:hypothetical protein
MGGMMRRFDVAASIADGPHASLTWVSLRKACRDAAPTRRAEHKALAGALGQNARGLLDNVWPDPLDGRFAAEKPNP